jgi:hypothetical protein
MMQAVNSQAFYPALMTAVSVPDICGALAHEGRQETKFYIQWFNDYAAIGFDGLIDGKIAWSLRNSVLHQGRLEVKAQSFNQVIIVTDNKGMSINHWGVKKSGKKYLVIELNTFCLQIYQSATKWLDTVETTKKYRNNYKLFFKKEKLKMPWDDEIDVIAVF